ncbi:PrpF domain-containing protein [Tateyamaria sp.]|uniref:PrpF domain-containing protein n=1 Tax=Tateyamaria sp. TaxID=1929288 RepID=UPI00329C9245
MAWKTRPTIAVAGALCLASCVLTPGTVADGLVAIPNVVPATPTLKHASGQIEVVVDYGQTDTGIVIKIAGLIHSARTLAAGEVFVSP